MTDFTLMMTKRFYEMHLHNLTQIIGIRKITKIICLKKIEIHFTKMIRKYLFFYFCLFPPIYSGFITPEDLGTLLKSLGQNPTDEQMEELMKVSLQNYVLEIGI